MFTDTCKYVTSGEKQLFWRLNLIILSDGRGDARSSAIRSDKLQLAFVQSQTFLQISGKLFANNQNFAYQLKVISLYKFI